MEYTWIKNTLTLFCMMWNTNITVVWELQIQDQLGNKIYSWYIQTKLQYLLRQAGSAVKW